MIINRLQFVSFLLKVIVISVLSVASMSVPAENQMSASASASASNALDIDGNQKFDALTDGLLILRHLFGLSGSALTSGVVATDATYTDSITLSSRIDRLGQQLDIDGNGEQDALTDGLVILRFLFGLRGDLLIDGVISQDSTRSNATEVEGYLNALASQPALLDNLVGTGSLKFNDESIEINRDMNVYYHIPSDATVFTPIMFVIHGGARDPDIYRDRLISYANSSNFIVIAPEFSSALFPGGDGFNLGNVFVDGDNPSSNTLNDQEYWAFSTIEPLFDFVRQQLGTQVSSYSVFGHSAGGQFAHRLLMFKPNARINKMIASASGWYTTVDNSTSFPYGFGSSPLEDIDLLDLFSKDLTVLVGEYDNDPNADNLRRNDTVDLQGISRLARARFFYEQAESKASSLNIPFNWTLIFNDNAGHDLSLATKRAVELLYD